MRSAADVEAVFELLDQGLSQAETSRRTGVSRAAIRDWQRVGRTARLKTSRARDDHTTCRSRLLARPAVYAYLLGQYLGDGCISPMRKGVHRLRLACSEAYPDILDECRLAIRLVVPNHVGTIAREGCIEVYSDWTHWPCAFPQAGPGPKHHRPIELESWQRDIATQHAGRLIRGLIHSDGCRCINRVKRKQAGAPPYEYLRYFFSNRSEDILRIFTDACDTLGVQWRRDGPWNISIARQESIQIVDDHMGPKS
jgi:hypothetical protein